MTAHNYKCVDFYFKIMYLAMQIPLGKIYLSIKFHLNLRSKNITKYPVKCLCNENCNQCITLKFKLDY